MKFMLENGFLEYERMGKGTPLLFIHGYPLSKKIWAAQTKKLTDIAEVISVDLRGHGESYPFSGPYTMDMLANDCYQLLNHLDIRPPFTICGLSMGGYVTFALYRQVPQLFKGMILTSTRAAADSPEGKTSRDTGIKNVQEHGVPFITDGMLPKIVSPKTLQANPSLVASIRSIMLETSVNGVSGALQGMRDRPDSTSLLTQIKCPVLIVHGADDQLILVSEAELMKQGIPDANLVIVPESGHLTNMEQPDLFNRAVRGFITSLPQA
jgi:3-oxoadipate enol-lactonase